MHACVGVFVFECMCVYVFVHVYVCVYVYVSCVSTYCCSDGSDSGKNTEVTRLMRRSCRVTFVS